MLRRMILSLLCVQLVASSIFFGAVHLWAWNALVIISLIILLLVWCDKTLRHAPFPLSRSVSLWLLLFVASLLLQLVLGAPQVKLSVPSQWQPLASQLSIEQTIPGIFSPYYARLALYQWIPPIVAFITVPYVVTSRRDVSILIGSLLFVALLQGIYGIVQYLSPQDPLAYFARADKQSPVSGTYLCHTTYACFMAMSILMALGWWIDIHNKGEQKTFHIPDSLQLNWRLRENPYWHRILLLSTAIIAMTLGLVFSLSRGGVICLTVASIAFVFLYRLLMPDYRRSFSLWWLLSTTIALPIVFYLYFAGIEPMLRCFSNLPAGDIEGRWEIYRSTWNIIATHGILGCGGGCYPYALPVYQNYGLRPYFYAHNDYLQFLSEYGMISLLLAFVFCGKWLAEVLKTPCSIFFCGRRAGCLAALVVLCVHGTFDFSFHIPGHRLAGALIMGILLVFEKTTTDSIDGINRSS